MLGPDRSLLRELAGACGDLGTFLPLTLGAILVGGLPAGSVFVGFGLAYGLTAAAYRAPIPVQPMKVAGAVLVTTAPAVDTVIGAGMILGMMFLLLGSGRWAEWLAAHIPDTVVAGLQAGLGIHLGWSALGLLIPTPVAAVAFVGLAGGLLYWRPRWPAALIILAVSALALPWLGMATLSPIASPGLGTPHLPGFDALVTGALLIALPQFPLTLTNAVMVTARTGREYFPQAPRLDMRHLALTTGAINLLTAPLGAMPMCHGAGGVAAHYRFGARTWRAPAGLGLALALLGLFAAGTTTSLLARIPDAALGALLLIPAIDLVRIVQWSAFAPRERALVAGLTTIAVFSPALAFILGMGIAPALRWYQRI